VVTPKTVLIADDDCALLQALAVRCRELGLKVLLARDAMTALRFVHRRRPDLVCLDVNMPAGNGLSVCEMLASDRELCSIPVIILTGRTDEECIRRCHSMCAYYVLKSRDVWERMEPIICELLDIGSLESNRPEASDKAAVTHRQSAAPHRSLDHLLQVIRRETSLPAPGSARENAPSR